MKDIQKGTRVLQTLCSEGKFKRALPLAARVRASLGPCCAPAFPVGGRDPRTYCPAAHAALLPCCACGPAARYALGPTDPLLCPALRRCLW